MINARTQSFKDWCRDFGHATVQVNADMLAVTGSQQQVVRGSANFVAKAHLAAAQFGRPREDAHGIAEAGGVAIFNLDPDDGKMIAAVSHLTVGHTHGVHPGDASGLKPDDVVAVMHDAHCVGLGKAYRDVQGNNRFEMGHSSLLQAYPRIAPGYFV